MSRKPIYHLSKFAVVSLLTITCLVNAQSNNQSINSELKSDAIQSIDKAIEYLRSVQNADGSFAEDTFGLPITGLVVNGALRTKRVTPQDPMMAKALKYLESFIKEDGGIYANLQQRNYPTCICVLAFKAANQNDQYSKTIKSAVKFIKENQWDEAEGIDLDNPKYGGFGYGRKSRPDLSNTSFAIEAMREGGVAEDDPALRRALAFVTRCQNFTGEGGNDQVQAKKVDDGGFYYTPAEDYNPGGGDMKTGLRSYASMTYAGLKSFIHAGLSKDDPRVLAAMEWIKKNYNLKENPGMGLQGLFYYYHTFAKALNIVGTDSFVDNQNQTHLWRADLLKVLVNEQQENGSWINKEKRWLEDNPKLVTAYALMAMSEALND